MGKILGSLAGLLLLGALCAQETLKAPKAPATVDIWEAAQTQDLSAVNKQS